MFTIVDGRQSADFNHFSLYSLEEVEATETRLMGVVALKLSWKSSESKAAFYQIIHLDFSEYGIDDYFEYECLPESEDFHDMKENMEWKWKSFTDVMGGKVITIHPEVAMRLIDIANEIWLGSQLLKSGRDDNVEFRRAAMKRVDIMRSTLIEQGRIPEAYSEIVTEEECIRVTAKKKLTSYETINYFVMRLVDHDLAAAAFLSTFSKEELAQSELLATELQTLMHNSISAGKSGIYLNRDDSFPYYCKYLSMGFNYYYGSLELTLSGGPLQKDRKVTAFEVGYHKKLSQYEADLLLRRSEYITVYDVDDSAMYGFDLSASNLLNGVDPKICENGWLFLKYNPDNSHVDKAEYYLNGDVYGSAVLTLAGEFIVMSYKLMNISLLEADLASIPLAAHMHLKGRYEVNNQVFSTVCNNTGIMFDDAIEPPEE